MFEKAREEPMVMQMVIAMGLQEMNHRRPRPEKEAKQKALLKYSGAIRRLADIVSPINEFKNFDAIYTALWMMLLYEQQYGDANGTAYEHHLSGISSLLKHQSTRTILEEPDNRGGGVAKKLTMMMGDAQLEQRTNLSVYSARVLVWIALLDAAAASSGIGGQVNETILRTLASDTAEFSKPSASPIKAFDTLHRYSGPLYTMAWGQQYPKGELLEDIQNRSAFSLLAACVQLRFLTAQLAQIYREDPTAASQRSLHVKDCIDNVATSFSDTLGTTGKYSMETNDHNRSFAIVCAVVPMFHAVVLDYMRLTAFDRPLGDKQHLALKEILNLAFQGRKYGGDEAMIKIAWPLFIAALESDDLLHRDWILKQFKNISKYGSNFARAHEFLLRVLPLQQQLGKRVNTQEHLDSTSRFVLV